MGNKSELGLDDARIDRIARKYSGATGAHLYYIEEADGGHRFGIGGRADLICMGIAKIIAQVIMITPGLDGGGFLDAISRSVIEILNASPKRAQ